MRPAKLAEPGRLATTIVYVTFAATGIGVQVPGALLPTLLARWSMSDQQAGVLFFLFFIGSTGGALLSRGSMPRSIARGALAIAGGTVGLAIASHAAVFVAMPLFGLGLGIVMTSSSLLQSRWHPAERTLQMARLNLLWSLGALLGPLLILRGAARFGMPTVLYAAAALFLFAGALVLACVRNAPLGPALPVARGRVVPAMLLVAVLFATGIESAAGGWLTTYSKRTGQTLGMVIGAVSCFWAGMLLSRLLQSNRRVAAAERPMLLTLPWLMFTGMVLVIAFHAGSWIAVGALLLGLGVGPLYPLLLAVVLRDGEGGNAVFIAAGLGAAVLPLLTGLISGWSGSLRAGLLAPLAGTLVIAFVGLRLAYHAEPAGEVFE